MDFKIDISKYMERFSQPVSFKSFRDELITRLMEGINKERVGTKYKPVTKRTLAIKINKNPFLSKSDGELELLIKECEARGNYKKFWFIVK